ncbi:MAG: hypothetical protein KF779_13020 [Hyphomonadaceae bacterium]|nr:hypothetical protein [Hyphomonadaceae bacterium]
MRLLVASAVAACAIASAALAQNAQPTIRYVWDQRPDGIAFARHFPIRAQHDEVAGAAVLCCAVNADRTLNCTSPLEWPAGYGFGEASLSISRYFRLSEASYAEVRADPGHTIRQTIRWVLPNRGNEYPPEEFREAARTICNGATTPIS